MKHRPRLGLAFLGDLPRARSCCDWFFVVFVVLFFFVLGVLSLVAHILLRCW